MSDAEKAARREEVDAVILSARRSLDKNPQRAKEIRENWGLRYHEEKTNAEFIRESEGENDLQR